MIPAILNPEARQAESARAALEAAGGFALQECQPDQVADAVREALRAGASRIVVCGGDGTIGTAATVLANTGVELAIIPGGTLNHLAKDLGLPLDVAEAVRVAAGPRTRDIDIAAVNARGFVGTSSVGAYADFVRLRDRIERRLGYHVASLIAGLRMVFRLPLFRVTLETNGVAHTYTTPLVFIGVDERELKLPTLGARVADGRRGLHVMVIRQRSGARVLALALAAAARGVHSVARTPALDAFLVDHLRIDPPHRTVAVDGELTRLEPPLEYRLLRGAVRVVVGGEEVGGRA